MRRPAALLGVVLALAAVPAAALGIRRLTADAFRWDPRRTAGPPFVGRKHFIEVQRTNSRRSMVVGSPGSREEGQISVGYRGVQEVVAVENGRATEKRIKVENWRAAIGNGPTDSSLEGKTILVRMAKEVTYALEQPTGAKLSEFATEWVSSEIVRDAARAENAPGELDVLSPGEPVGVDATWTVDPKPVDETLFAGVPFDPARSKGSCKLSSIRVENGLHLGTLEADFSIRLIQVPGEALFWIDGGVATLTIRAERSLEPEKKNVRSWKMTANIGGVAKRSTKPEAPVYEVAIGVSEERKWGPLDAP